MSKSKKAILTLKDVEKVAELARLRLTPEEKEKYLSQLSSILDFVNKLDEIDTIDIEPISQVNGLENVFREDTVKPSLTPQEAIANAPSTYKDYIKVKAIFEE